MSPDDSLIGADTYSIDLGIWFGKKVINLLFVLVLTLFLTPR
jgi:hypothetical protein